MQSRYLLHGRFASFAAKQEEKKLSVPGPEGKAELWQLDGLWVFFLLQAGKTHDEGEEEGKTDRSRAGGTLGQAASVTQRNGLAMLSGSPCSEPSLLIAHTPRAHQPARPGSKGERAISSKRRRQLDPDSLSQPRHTLC